MPRYRQKSESISELASAIMKLTRQAYPKANMQLLETLAIDYFIDALDDPDIRMRLRQSQPDTLTLAETLTIRLDTCKTADKVKHRAVFLSKESEENVKLDDGSRVEDRLIPVLENFMSKITNEVSHIKSKLDQTQENKNWGNQQRFGEKVKQNSKGNSNDQKSAVKPKANSSNFCPVKGQNFQNKGNRS